MSDPVPGFFKELTVDEQRMMDALLVVCKKAGIEKPHMRSRRDSESSQYIVEVFDDAAFLPVPLFGAAAGSRHALFHQLVRAALAYTERARNE